MTSASPPSKDADQVHVSIEQMLATRLSVANVTVQGAARTDPNLLNAVVKPVLSTGGTFQGVVEDVSAAVDRLRSTGCFKGVDALLDRADHPNHADVQFTVNEKSLYQIHTGTSIETTGDRDASLEGSFVWRNVRGKTDTLKATVAWMGAASPTRSFAKFPSTMCHMQYTVPFVLGLNSALFADLRRSLHNHEQQSSYNLHVTRAQCALELPIGQLSLSSSWREVANVDANASQLIQEEAGHSWKTSLHHRFQNEARDYPPMPTAGVYTSVHSEWALPVLGDASFAKVEVVQQLHIPLASSGACISISAREGVVASRNDRRVRVMDRFFVGGPNSMRGFDHRGIGPRDAADSIGGDVFYTLTGMFSVPMPSASLLSQLFNARMHVFGTVGDLGDMSLVKDSLVRLRKRDGTLQLKDKANKLWDDLYASMRIAVGLGVALETSIGRIEVNYCQTMRSSDGDRAVSGVQVGISESFL